MKGFGVGFGIGALVLRQHDITGRDDNDIASSAFTIKDRSKKSRRWGATGLRYY
jgi:hypothetical protein